MVSLTMLNLNYLVSKVVFAIGLILSSNLVISTHALADLTPQDFMQDGVIVLNSETFDETIKKRKFVLIQFYSPWCGHCKQFRGEYLKASKKMQEKNHDVQFAVVDATAETKLSELYGVRGYPTLKFFHQGREMEYGGGRMAENIVAWVEKKVGPVLVDLRSSEEVNVFFDEKSRDATPSGADMAIGGAIVVAFTSNPELITILEDVAVTMDDMFFGIAPVSEMNQVIDTNLISNTQKQLDIEAQKLNDGSSDKEAASKSTGTGTNSNIAKAPDISKGDIIYMRFPFDQGHAVAPIISTETLKLGKDHPEYIERAGDDIRFFIAVHMMPNVNHFTGENAALIFNDPRPLLIFFRDESRGVISEKYAEEIKKQTATIELGMKDIAEKYKNDFLVVFSGSEQPMEMRLMDYITVDYEDLPAIRIVKNPTDSLVKYKLPITIPSESEDKDLSYLVSLITIPSESEDKDLSYLNNALAITPEKITNFAESFLIGDAEPHLKSQPIPRNSNNPTDQGTVFTLVGEQFLDVLKQHNTLVMYSAPWCGHCKKMEPIYRELAAKYNVPGGKVLITSFDNTANDIPLEIDDIIEGYPTLKLYLKDSKREGGGSSKSETDSGSGDKSSGLVTFSSVHYAGDRHLETLIEFIETNVPNSDSGGGGDRQEL